MNTEIIYQLVLAVILGGLIGLEREIKRKEAGLQTYSLVCLGTCLFTIIALELIRIFAGQASINLDPTRIIQAIAIGIGFIGAGVIFHYGAGIRGLTTAAGLWVTAGIGIAVGIKFCLLAVIVTLLTLFILIVFGSIERKFLGKK